MHTVHTVTRRAALGAAAALALAGLAACGGGASGTTPTSGTAAAAVNLGYFPNVTHATGIVADKEGFFVKHLGSTTLAVKTFNAGPAAMEALKSGAIDATYVGPGPATNAYLNSKGAALRVVSGATSGGSFFVVDPSITSAADLKGKKVATPQLGNTQDIALRYWLKQQGLTSDLQGGGDVSIAPQDNSQIVDAFSQKLIAGAWVPEPYATRLVKAGGHILVDERDLWPGGRYPTTVLAVRTDFLKEHPDTVRALVEGQLDAESFIGKNPEKAQADVTSVIATVTGKAPSAGLIPAAWKNLTFTNNPVPSAIVEGAKHAYEVGILKVEPQLDGLADLAILNAALKARGLAAVTS